MEGEGRREGENEGKEKVRDTYIDRATLTNRLHQRDVVATAMAEG